MDQHEEGRGWSLPDDPLGAFCRENHVALPGAESGPLAGLSFAAKDVYAIAGARTGNGHPDWLRTHKSEAATAPAVQRVLDAGASLAGKTHTDELCYSLTGENFHYGTPCNPRDPARVPGGSSSGSASAVAGGLVDFALGTDCGGSIRVPASYCGVYGMRPTHGRVPLDGVPPFAPSFDTAGWFAREASLMQRVGRVLLADDRPARPARKLLIYADAFDLVAPEIAGALGPGLAEIARLTGAPAERVHIAEAGLEAWAQTFRTIQGAEIWASLGGWITGTRPVFGPGVGERFAAAGQISGDAQEAALSQRAEIARRLDGLLEPDALLCLPTVPRPAPLKGLPADDIEVAYRNQALNLLCTAGLAGLPQLCMPLAEFEGLPVGLSIIGPRGADLDLLDLAARLEAESKAAGRVTPAAS